MEIPPRFKDRCGEVVTRVGYGDWDDTIPRVRQACVPGALSVSALSAVDTPDFALSPERMLLYDNLDEHRPLTGAVPFAFCRR